MARYISVGIDVGTHTTRVVVSEVDSNGALPKVIGSGKAETLGLRQGYIVNLNDAVRSIRQAVVAAEKSSGIKIKKALVSIGGVSLESATTLGESIISKVDGEISELDVDKALQGSKDKIPNLSNRKVLHKIPLAFRLDGKEVLGRPVGMRGLKLEARVLYVTCLSQHLDDLIRAMEMAGIEVEDVAASSIAASLVTLTKAQRTAGCVLVNIGAETVSIAVFENDIPISLQVFPIGSTDITNDIALGLKIPLEEAEDIKTGIINTSQYPRKKLEEIIAARLSDIFELVEAHLKKLGRSELLPAGVVITGGGSGITTIEDMAKAALKLPARIGIPQLISSSKGEIRDASWSVAYGLCILGANDNYSSDFAPPSGKDRLRGVTKEILSWAKQFLP